LASLIEDVNNEDLDDNSESDEEEDIDHSDDLDSEAHTDDEASVAPKRQRVVAPSGPPSTIGKNSNVAN
jgi:hypothetical protein